jgi:Leucine-rich repeat (LRR) protein
MNKFNRAYYNKILKEADSKNGRIDNIHLGHSFLKTLPDFFKDLSVTIEFGVSYNMLKSCKNFPKFVGERLFAYENNISDLEGLSNIPRQTLQMGYNKINSLNYLSLFAENSCNTVAFAGNKLTSLKGIENISILELSVYNNQITTWDYIPSSLTYLDIHGNKLTSWEGMPRGLESLSIDENWDVVDFEGYKEVSTDLTFSSTKWKHDYQVWDELTRLGIDPPDSIDPN